MKQSRVFLLILCAALWGIPGDLSAQPATPTLRTLEANTPPATEPVTVAASASPLVSSSATIIASSPPVDHGSASFSAPVATDPFFIPTRPADTTITSESLEMASGATILIGNVRAIDGDRILTCGKAWVWREPDRLMASLTPRLYQKESVPAKMLTRETTVDALTMFWNKGTDRLSASPSVTVKIEERSWDLATYTCVTISADSLEGFPGQRLLNFQGNVRIRDKEHYGQGRRLDYDKASGTVTLRGDAHVEKDEWSPKEKRMIKRVLEGEIINYDLASKTTNSE